MQRKKNEHATFDPALDAQAARASELALLADALENPARTFPESSRRDLCGDDFENADIGGAFDAARALFAEGLAVDAVTVLERLSADGETAAAATVEEATRGVPLPCHAAAHVEAIRRRATLRRVASLGMRLAADAGNRKGAPDALLSQAADEIAALQRSQRGDRTAADEIAAIVADAMNPPAKPRGAPLPTAEMSRIYGGALEPGLHVLAAKTSAGKSLVEGAVARTCALSGGRVLRCFLDMEPRRLLERDLCALCFVSVFRMHGGGLNDSERAFLPLAAAAWKSSLGIEIMTAPRLSEITARARAMKSDMGLDLLTVDFVQNLQTGNPRLDGTGNANARISACTSALKTFAIREGVPVLLLSQLNRAERDETTPPTLADLRDSGSIEQDAFSVAFLYPDAEAAAQFVAASRGRARTWRDLRTRPMRYAVAKNQQGALGAVALRMRCTAFAVEDAALVPNPNPADDALRVTDWTRPAATSAEAPAPVIARDAAGHVGAFDARFLPLVNAEADKQGKPRFEPVETVSGGLDAVAARLAEIRGGRRAAVDFGGKDGGLDA